MRFHFQEYSNEVLTFTEQAWEKYSLKDPRKFLEDAVSHQLATKAENNPLEIQT